MYFEHEATFFLWSSLLKILELHLNLVHIAGSVCGLTPKIVERLASLTILNHNKIISVISLLCYTIRPLQENSLFPISRPHADSLPAWSFIIAVN